MAFTPFVESDQPTMANFNEKFLACIAEAVGQAPKIVTGSYAGTGTYGSSNKNTLTFPSKPLVIFLARGGNGYPYGPHVLINGDPEGRTYYSSNSGTVIYLTWGETSVSWYNDTNTIHHLNESGVTYYYAAILDPEVTT